MSKTHHWNYRLMQKFNPVSNENEYAIHEVYYDENNKVQGWTENPVTLVAESKKELLASLELMKLAFEKEILPWE